MNQEPITPAMIKELARHTDVKLTVRMVARQSRNVPALDSPLSTLHFRKEAPID